MALYRVSVLAMSRDSEIISLLCNLLITGQKNGLEADIIEATQCWKDVADFKAERQRVEPGRGDCSTR
jgi:hypothetical protein